MSYSHFGTNLVSISWTIEIIANEELVSSEKIELLKPLNQGVKEKSDLDWQILELERNI